MLFSVLDLISEHQQCWLFLGRDFILTVGQLKVGWWHIPVFWVHMHDKLICINVVLLLSIRNWELFISEQLAFFLKTHLPFYLDLVIDYG